MLENKIKVLMTESVEALKKVFISRNKKGPCMNFQILPHECLH